MAKPWDDTLKKLIHANPRSFVQWLLPRATYVRELPTTLQQEELRVDALLEVVANNKTMLLHIEFQTRNDKAMRERLLRYNVLIRSSYQLPVWSCVIYLLKDGDVEDSPLEWAIPTGQDVIKFYFQNIELAKTTPDDLLHLQLTGLLPLLPLTKGGEKRTTIERMFQEIGTITEFEETKRNDLEVIGYTLASLVLKRTNKNELNWLIRSFREMHDILRDTPIFQEIMREGHEKGLEEGLEKGLEEGREEGLLEGARNMLLVIIQARFPKLKRVAENQMKQVKDVHVLEQLVFKIVNAPTLADAALLFLDLEDSEQES